VVTAAPVQACADASAAAHGRCGAQIEFRSLAKSLFPDFDTEQKMIEHRRANRIAWRLLKKKRRIAAASLNT
jgi:hypothetical protein